MTTSGTEFLSLPPEILFEIIKKTDPIILSQVNKEIYSLTQLVFKDAVRYIKEHSPKELAGRLSSTEGNPKHIFEKLISQINQEAKRLGCTQLAPIGLDSRSRMQWEYEHLAESIESINQKTAELKARDLDGFAYAVFGLFYRDLDLNPQVWENCKEASIGLLRTRAGFVLRSFCFLPEEIGRLKNLEELTISMHNFLELPESIGKLGKLKMLKLHSSQIYRLPKEIGQLVNLKELDLGYNQIKQLPKEIGQLVNLEKLDLGYNQLKQLPKEIGQLVNLEKLDLGYNQLKQLPKEIGQLDKLKKLALSFNNLELLAESINKLVNLEELYLDCNRLDRLPSMDRLNKLHTLDIMHNNFFTFPKCLNYSPTLLYNQFIRYNLNLEDIKELTGSKTEEGCNIL